jgi:hypothetical protein
LKFPPGHHQLHENNNAKTLLTIQRERKMLRLCQVAEVEVEVLHKNTQMYVFFGLYTHLAYAINKICSIYYRHFTYNLQGFEKLPSGSQPESKTNPRKVVESRKKASHLEPQTLFPYQTSLSGAHSEHSELESKIDNVRGSFNSDAASRYESLSDNGSEISDEGYRSLGLVHSNNVKAVSLLNQTTTDQGNKIENLSHNG